MTRKDNQGQDERVEARLFYREDGSGRVDSTLDAAGNKLSYTYSGICPWPESTTVTEVCGTEGTEVCGGEQIAVTSGFRYDALGRAVEETVNGKLVVQRRYDEVGNLLEVGSGGSSPGLKE